MSSLHSILEAFTLPPGVFIVLLIGSGSLLIFKKRKIAGIYNLIVAGLMWLLSISPFSNALIGSLESGLKLPNDPQGDVIILLGERVYPYVPDIFGTGTPSGIMLNRIIPAAELHKKTGIPIIVTHGIDLKTGYSKASVVKRYLIHLGIPDNKIILEEKARNTFENAKYSIKLCAENEFATPILVTSAYHMKRSILSFNKHQKKVVAYPAHFLSWKNRDYSWDSFLPKNKNLRNSSMALKEYLGLVFYHFFY